MIVKVFADADVSGIARPVIENCDVEFNLISYLNVSCDISHFNNAQISVWKHSEYFPVRITGVI